MFDNGVDELDVDQTLDRVAARHARIAALEAEQLLDALHYADLNATVAPPPGGEIVPGVERLRVYGGEGCPPIAEFSAQEFGWRLGMSHGVAADYLGEALALRHRFPKVLAQVLAGKAEVWRARWIARTCLSLTQAAAAIVDAKIHTLINTLTPSRLRRHVTAAKMQADPAKAKADADLHARQRGVWLGQSNDHGTKSVIARTAVGDAIRFDAAVEELAEILGQEGDTGSHQQRRARAVGLLADPAVALDLREHGRRKARQTAAQNADTTADQHSNDHDDCGQGAPCDQDEYSDNNTDVDSDGGNDGDTSDQSYDDHIGDDRDPGGGSDDDSDTGSKGSARDTGEDNVPVDRLLADLKTRNRSQAPHTFYVTIPLESLATGEGVAEVEGIGPILVSRLKELVGHEAVVLKPVIDLRRHLSTDDYKVPRRIREWVKLRYPTPMEPWATGETTFSTDLDHVVPFDTNGPPGQTNTRNLLPVTRTPHRGKTHGGLRNAMLPDGSAEWTTPRGARYLVDHTGTHYLGQVNLTTGELTPPPTKNGERATGKNNTKTAGNKSTSKKAGTEAGKKTAKTARTTKSRLRRIGLTPKEKPKDRA